MQQDWIGRSEGVEIEFDLADRDDELDVFTTRPDTLFGATYMALAPEHPLVKDIIGSVEDPEDREELQNFVDETKRIDQTQRAGGDLTKKVSLQESTPSIRRRVKKSRYGLPTSC